LITRAAEVLGRATRDVAFVLGYLTDTHADAPLDAYGRSRARRGRRD
jgi:hypothetical protein